MTGTIDKQRLAERRYAKTPRGQFVRHKQNARRRGVPFELTFESWWQLWQDSGKWEQRGNRFGRYCMLRVGDRGPYAVGNVVIGTWSENTAECNRTRWEEEAALPAAAPIDTQLEPDRDSCPF